MYFLRINKKTSDKKIKKNAGFTLIELLVVIFIIGIITASIVVDFKKNEKNNRLQISAQEIVQNIRKAQNMALSSVEYKGNVYSYGVHFNKISLPTSYYIFADEDGNNNYNPGNDEIVETIQLKQGILIDSISTGNQLDIVFTPPDAFVSFNAVTDEASITIKRKEGACPGDCKVIKIKNTGWVEIQ